MESGDGVTYPPELVDAALRYLQGALLTPHSDREHIAEMVLDGLGEAGYLRVSPTEKMSRGPHDRITLDGSDIEKRIPHENTASLDEIVISNCNIHLERMSDNHYYLGIWDQNDLLLQVGIHAYSKDSKTGRKRTLVAFVYGNENLDGIDVEDGAVYRS